MELLFADTRLQRLCACAPALRGRLGERGATEAIAHLASLRAAASLEDFRRLPGRCHERQGRLQLALPDGRCLQFEPIDDPHPTDGDGELDWTAVRSVRIVALANR